MSDHTPTTRAVADRYHLAGIPDDAPLSYARRERPISDAEFYRWLAQERATAQVEALREAALQYGPVRSTGMLSRDGYVRAWMQARANQIAHEAGIETGEK